MNTWMMINFQDCNSYIGMLMIYFHDFLMLILLMILFMVLYIMVWIFFNKFINLKILHNHFIEIIWTVLPMLILVYMAMPSLKILYLFEEMVKPYLTLKIVGHQWYWSYEYSDFMDVSFDSFMLNEFNLNNFRLLDVDNRLILPNNLNIRGLVTSMDVIHSWTIPSLGIKIDSIPGRLNQILININNYGLLYGQCSEICGMNHSFMPIVLESTSFNYFLKWVKNSNF